MTILRMLSAVFEPTETYYYRHFNDIPLIACHLGNWLNNFISERQEIANIFQQ